MKRVCTLSTRVVQHKLKHGLAEDIGLPANTVTGYLCIAFGLIFSLILSIGHLVGLITSLD